MLRTYNWLAADQSAICLAQSTFVAGTFLLNGTEVTYNTLGLPEFNYPGLYRSVSIQNHGTPSNTTNFTITGHYRGAIKTVTIAGSSSANGVVDTGTAGNFFSDIISVSVDSAVTNVSIGSGIMGQTIPYLYNNYLLLANIAIVAESLSGTTEFSASSTLDDVTTNASPFEQPIIVAATHNTYETISFPFKYLWFIFNESQSTDNTGAARFIIAGAQIAA